MILVETGKKRYIYLIGQKRLAFMLPIYFFRISSGNGRGTGRLDIMYVETYFRQPPMPVMEEIT